MTLSFQVTDAMIEAGLSAVPNWSDCLQQDEVSAMYLAMLQAGVADEGLQQRLAHAFLSSGDALNWQDANRLGDVVLSALGMRDDTLQAAVHE